MSGALPQGACDAHCHVYGPEARFPFADPAWTTDAPKEALAALHARLGFDRTVVVQPTVHGFDNRVTLDAVAAAPRSRRGVALVPETVTDAELAVLHQGGIRAVRFNFAPHLGPPVPLAAFRRIAARIAGLGWHVQLHAFGPGLAGLEPYIAATDTPFVIDHMGRVDVAKGVDQAPFQTLLGYAADPRCWIKISGADRMSQAGAPYDDAAAFMRALIEAAPDRVVWGSDWPHPNSAGPIPDEAVLLALLQRVAPEPAQFKAILVDNPNALYRFGE